MRNLKSKLKPITGFTLPIIGAGIEWDLSKSESEIIRHLINFLEDRRVLYNPYELESPHYVIQSILKIRHYLTETLNKLDKDSYLQHYIKAMRASCRKFLNKFPKGEPRGMIENNEAFASLGEVRAIFGFYLADLSNRFKLDIEDDLKSIFPAEDK